MQTVSVSRFLEKATGSLPYGRIYGREFLTNVIRQVRLFTLGDADAWKKKAGPGAVLVGSHQAFAESLFPGTEERGVSAFARPQPAFIALPDQEQNHADGTGMASYFSCPVVTFPINAHLLASRLQGALREQLDGKKQVGACLVAIGAVGVLITGESGAGKTRTSLALVARGHAWVADDVVAVSRTPDGRLYGSAPRAVARLMALKDRGIIPATHLIPHEQIKKNCQIKLVVEIMQNGEARSPEGENPLSTKEETAILDLPLPYYVITTMGAKDAADKIEIIAAGYHLSSRR
jgi:serine kinase of HPr protein (carbohydrate metabolism regulator)